MVPLNEYQATQGIYHSWSRPICKEHYIKIWKAIETSFKLKDSPLPSSFIPTKKDTLKIETGNKETRFWLGNMCIRYVIGALFYVLCCTRPDITYAINELTIVANNTGLHISQLFYSSFNS